MMRYWVEPRDRTFVKGYGFLSFAKNMGKNIGKNINKSLSGKYGPGMLPMRQNVLIMLKHLQQMHLNVFRKESFKKQQK